MLRNQHRSKQIVKYFLFSCQQQQRLLQQQSSVLYNKSTNVFRQGKIMEKLFGHRVSGSKKRWFPSADSTQSADSNVVFKQSQFGKAPNSRGKNDTRRVNVLNKLFMKHITDLMATGEISESILGKGLQVTRVKISQDFAFVNVFWLCSGEVGKDVLLEHELQRCSGLLRHELSQLCLMGEVPRIKFVKDKLYTNMHQVEALLKNMDFGTDEEEQQKNEIHFQIKHAADNLRQEFYGRKTTENPSKTQQDLKESTETINTLDINVPEMRHDSFGLDHKAIMLKILTKMRKSKQAWDQHLQNNTTDFDNDNTSTVPSTSFSQLAKINEKLAKADADSEKFKTFLAKRKEKRNTPERKQFNVYDHYVDKENAIDQHDSPELMLSSRQRQLYEAEDYLQDEIEEIKPKK